ncbi:ABC-F family ATP-binding cassette domain-containing protein [Erysipelothrix sp. HDW6A]|uniref:ABC-F family ATP-binding cassette domain-containing protein n=1 Tax=Erysipelothrix sp. HDW6A TaxID=2714928 RepID=UPI00351BB201
MIVNVRAANKSFGSQELFKNLNLKIDEREKVAIIGANGVGKTTLFHILQGTESLDSGDVFWASNIRIGFLEQLHLDDISITVKDYFNEAFKELFVLKDRLESLETTMLTDHSDAVLKQYDRVQQSFLRLGGYTYETEIHTILTKFNFTVEDLERPLNTFSGGQITRLAFIRLLLSKPDVLFLDEPTNHLDISTIEWLEGYLSSYDGAVVIVSHDRLFLDRVCRVVIEIENYQAERYESNYSGYQVLKEKNIERHNIKFQNQQREIERLEKLIEKFRFKRSKAAFAQSKIKYLDRMDKLEKIDVKKREFKANFKSKLRGGKEVLSISELAVGYDKPLLSMTYTFERGHRYAIVGDNGTGKSTLLKTLAGKLPPLQGEMLLGHQIEMGYFDQQLLNFSMNKTVLEEVWDDFPELDHTEIRQALGRFLFKGMMSLNL